MDLGSSTCLLKAHSLKSVKAGLFFTSPVISIKIISVAFFDFWVYPSKPTLATNQHNLVLE